MSLPRTPLLMYSPIVKYGIPEMAEGSSDFERFWTEEIRRCKEGYQPPGGVKVCGSYYRHLNHRPMRRRRYSKNHRVPSNIDPFDPPGSHPKILSYALYRDVDHELHEKIHQLRQERKRVGAYILKGRRKGTSDDIISIVEHEVQFNTAAEAFYATPDDYALNKIKEKFVTSINNSNPQIIQPFSVDNKDEIKLGMNVTTSYGKKTLGSESILYTSNIPNPAIWKGGFYSLGVTDEVGTFKKITMQAYWGDTKDCFQEGDVIMGFHIFLGTVDQVSYSKNTDVELMWRNSEAYNFERILIPADKAYGDYIDLTTGKSDQPAARKKIYSIRAALEKLDDKTSYWKEVQNNPLDESELFLLTINSKINVHNINEQIKRISLNKELEDIAKFGELVWERETVNKVLKYTGRVLFVEKPGGLWCKTYDPINHIYPDADITAIDDYFKDEAPESDSLGGIVIWRRVINAMEVYRIPIATYLGRPAKLSDFHDEALKAAVWSNSRAAVEMHNSMMKEHFLKSTKVTGRNYLKIFPWVLGKQVKESDAYGYNLKDLKSNIEERLKMWSDEAYMQNCFDIRFLKNIAIFGKANSDLGSAAGVALCYEEDMDRVPVKKIGAEDEQNERLLRTHFEMQRNGVPIQVMHRAGTGRVKFRKMQGWMNEINRPR